jgi:competence protein ComEC
MYSSELAESLRLRSQGIMHIAPLFPVAAGLVAGIVLDRGLHIQPAVYIAAFAVTCSITAVRSIRAMLAPALLFMASLSAGGMLHLSVVRTIPPSSVEWYTSDDQRIARIRGTIASWPRILKSDDNPFAGWTYGGDRTAFLLEVESIEGVDGDIPASGLIRVTVQEAVLDLGEDERVEVFGWLYRLRPPANPGAFDWASFYRRQGIVGGLSCNLQENVRRLDPDPPALPGSLVSWFRAAVRGMLTDDLATGTDEEASLLEAMVLGHRSGLDRRLNEVFILAGCIHFLAVSGVHVVIVMFLARLICRPFFARPRTRTWVMLLAVIVYAVVAEPRPPILRASIISGLYCIARLLGRQRACLNWISASAIILAIADPPMVFDAGFQLSFAAVFGVSYLTPALARLAGALTEQWRRVFRRGTLQIDDLKPTLSQKFGRSTVSRAGRWLWRCIYGYAPYAIAVTTGAWLAALPIIAAHFQRVQPWAALNSLLVFPLVGVVMGLGFAKLLLGGLFPSLGPYLAVPLAAADSFLIRFVERLSSLPGVSLDVQTPPAWLIAAYYVFLLAVIWRFPRRSYYERAYQDEDEVRTGEATQEATPGSPWPSRACVAATVLLIAGCTVWFRPKPPEERMVVTVLAVGPGSAAVIQLPGGQTILSDAGSSRPYDIGRNTIMPFLRHRGIRRLDRVYIGHPNLDHFSGIPAILEEVDTGDVLVNRYFEPKSIPRSSGRRLLDILTERGHNVQTLDPAVTRWEYGGVTFELLSPLGDFDGSLPTNETSTVLRLSYAGHSILLTGDIEDRTQRALLDRGHLHADVLVLPHHGGMRRSSGDFFHAVSPGVVIRSSNQKMAETFSGLQEILGTVPLYNTADLGAVEVVIDHEGVRVRCMHPQVGPAQCTPICQ